MFNQAFMNRGFGFYVAKGLPVCQRQVFFVVDHRTENVSRHPAGDEPVPKIQLVHPP